jgi:polyphenol oxidase
VYDDFCPLTSHLLTAAGFRHGFFTRLGGVSTGAYASLNFSTTVGDESDCVLENTARAAAWLDLESTNLYCAQQVHGANVLEILAESTPQNIAVSPADALISARHLTACCVRTADCVPLLVGDPKQGSVAAIHAGWRGVVAGIVTRAIERLSETGSEPNQLLVAIGPHIRSPAFEVSEQVAQTIANVTPRCPVVQRHLGLLPHVALAECVREQLRMAGVAPANIDDVGGCTFSDSTRFFSFRRQGPASGRHLHAIVSRLTG